MIISSIQCTTRDYSFRKSVKNRAWLTFAASYFFLFLSLTYAVDIGVNWEYYGFGYKFSAVRFAMGYSSVLLFCFIARASDDTVSFYQGLTILMLLCPGSVYYGLGNARDEYFFALILGILVMFIASRLPIKRPVIAKISRRSFVILLVSLTATCIFAMIAFGGMRYFNLNPMSVYLYRRSAENLLPSIFGYITSPVAKVIIPIGIILGVYYRSYMIVSIFFVLTLLFFGLTHHKSVLAAPFAVLIFYISLKWFPVQKCLAITFITIASIGMIELIWRQSLGLTNSGMFSTFFTRRVFFIPSLLDNFYVQFFIENDFYYWATSRITFNFVETSYKLTAPFLVGEQLLGRSDISANTGFIGSGFSNAGTTGVIFYGAALGLVLAVLNAHGRHLGQAFVTCSALMVTMSVITSSDFVTVLITHGLMFLLICLALMPSASPNGSTL